MFSKFLSEFHDELLRKERLDYGAALRIFEAMWDEARKLGVLPLKDPLEGIEVDIRIARILNHHLSGSFASSDTQGPLLFPPTSPAPS